MTDASAKWTIEDLRSDALDRIRQTAELLREGFLGRTHDWQTVEDATSEVLESFGEGRISRVLVDTDGSVRGWIGAIPLSHYPGGVWELHPLVVSSAHRGLGLGRRLVRDLEDEIELRGGRTVYLGTDDENFETSLGGADLYTDLPGALRDLQNPGGHPLGFYQRLGYTVVGVLPDANGPGKPDIFMAKRLER